MKKKLGVLLMMAVLIFTSLAFTGCSNTATDDDLSQVPGVDDNLDNNRDDSLTEDLRDGADDLGDDIKDGAQDMVDDTEDVLDGKDTTENRTN